MKIVSNSDVQHVGTINKSIDFGIDKENIGVLFRGFSDTLYSNKIGSIVRELTSNCFDSHREAKVKDDVVIILQNADPLVSKNGKICFKDVGVGLSPKRIEDIYSKYFSSTKRETNNEIGGFGIGAKSPLAYTDVFEVNTIYNGIAYNYIVHRGEQVPMIKLVHKQATDQNNGTSVILPVRPGDEEKFISECRHQLRFFDNITYKGMNINNNYKVYKGKHWIASLHGEKDHVEYRLSICLGGVSYPLDTNQVRFDQYFSEYNNTSIALNFDIGEIDVTMSRENIEYNDRTIKAIKEKYALVQTELCDMFDKSWSKVIDFREYFINTNSNRHRDVKLPVADSFVDITFCKQNSGEVKFAPWDIYIDTKMVDSIIKTYVVANGKRDMKKYDNYASRLLKHYTPEDCWFRKRGKLSTLKSNYITDEWIPENTNLDHTDLFVCVELQTEPDWESYVWTDKDKERYDIIKPLLLRYIMDKCAGKYDDIEVPDSYKPASNTAIKAKVPRTQVCARYTRFDGEYNRHEPGDVRFSKQNYMYDAIENLINQGHTIIYGNMEEEETLRQLAFVMTALPEWRSSKKYDEMHKSNLHVHKIANSHMKHYKTLGALTPKEFIIKFYNQLMGISMCDLLGTMYRDNQKLFDPIYGVFPKGMQHMMLHCMGYVDAYRNLGDDPLWKSWVNSRYSSYGTVANDGNHIKALKSLCEKYDIPYNPENHVLHFGKHQLHTDSFFKLFKEVVEELGWIDQYFNIVTNDKESLLEDKALSIIKEIPSRNYSKLIYKINNYFKNE